MPRVLRNVSKKFFVVLNLLAAILFLLACCNAWLNPSRYWYIAVLGIGFPFIVLALICFALFWAFFKSKWFLFCIIVLLAGWQQVHVLFALHGFSSFDTKRTPGSLRIMQWNVSRLDQMNPKRPGGSYRKRILDFIADMNPDVVCMEEFLESNNPREFDQNIPYFTDTLKLAYHFFAADHRRWDGVYEHGVIIFSRYPLTDTVRLRYSGPDSLRAAESLIHADVNVNGQVVRIFATHLQSLRFDGNDYMTIHTLAKGGEQDGTIDKSKGILKKFKIAYGLRSQQSELVRREMDNSPYPVVLCADFNDVPNSFTYSRVKGDRNDAFLSSGFGIGRTFASLSPTLRIDYILADKKLGVLQFKKTLLPYSDHYPLIADLELNVK